MKRSCRELSVNMVIHKVIFENTQIMIFSCFMPSYLKQGLVVTELNTAYFSATAACR